MNNSNPNSNALFQQYLLEKELGNLILNTPQENRRGLYRAVYKRFYEELPAERKALLFRSEAQKKVVSDLKFKLVKPFLSSADLTFMEIGAGDNHFLNHLAKCLRQLISIEAADDMIPYSDHENISVIIDDFPPYNVGSNSVDLAFSSHFIEHLHPEDAYLHMLDFKRILKVNGYYICITPNKIYGPHDISGYFSQEAEGLHIKEYTYSSLTSLFRKAGFRNLRSVAKIGETPSKFKLIQKIWLERLILALPFQQRRKVMGRFFIRKSPFRPLEQVIIVAQK